MQNKWLKRVAAVLFGILWALFIAEIGTRVLVSNGVLPNRSPADIFDANPIGWGLKPDEDVHIFSDNGIIHVQTNAAGFRDEDYAYDNPRDRQRVLVLGDSYTLAIETPQDNVFHVLLEDRLTDTDVMSLGVSAYELAQHNLIYETEGQRYDPDTVLLMLYIGNDIQGNARWTHLPYYQLLDDGTLELVGFPYDGEFAMPFVVGQQSTALMKASPMIFVAGTLLDWRGGEANELATDFSYCDYWRNVNYPTIEEDDWQLGLALLQALQDRVAADGARLRVAVIPTEYQVEADDREAFLNDPCDIPEGDPPQQRLNAFMTEQGIDYLDLLPILTEQRESLGTDLYLPGEDWHLTITGHEVVAEALAAWLADAP